MTIVTNVPRLGQVSTPEQPITVLPIDEPASFTGAARLLKKHQNADVLLIDDAAPLLLKVCLLRWLMPRWLCGGPPVVSVDLILNKPGSWKDRIKVFFKRLLLSRVDHFLHYFVDVTAYHRLYGIAPARSTYVPFKVNFTEPLPAAQSDGAYVFTSGRSMRDYDTFMAAMERTGLPGILAYFKHELIHEHGTPFPPRHLPANVSVEEDDGSHDSWIGKMHGARVVVVPILGDAIRAAGIGMTLDALALGKCVILTEGVTTRGVFHGEVITVPPGNAEALASAITRAWEDDELRRDKGRRALEMTRRVGGERELHQRIVNVLRGRLRLSET